MENKYMVLYIMNIMNIINFSVPPCMWTHFPQDFVYSPGSNASACPMNATSKVFYYRYLPSPQQYNTSTQAHYTNSPQLAVQLYASEYIWPKWQELLSLFIITSLCFEPWAILK